MNAIRISWGDDFEGEVEVAVSFHPYGDAPTIKPEIVTTLTDGGRFRLRWTDPASAGCTVLHLIIWDAATGWVGVSIDGPASIDDMGERMLEFSTAASVIAYQALPDVPEGRLDGAGRVPMGDGLGWCDIRLAKPTAQARDVWDGTGGRK